MESTLATMPRRATGTDRPPPMGGRPHRHVPAQGARRRQALHDQPRHEPRGLVDGARSGRARADHAADRARHLGAAHQEGGRSERPRPRRGFARHRLPLVAAPQDRTGRQHGARLQVAARSRAAPPGGPRHGRARRAPCRRLSPAARRPWPIAAVGEHGPRPARPDPRRRRRVRAARCQPRARQAPAHEGAEVEPHVPRARHGGRPARRGGRLGAGAAGASALRPPRLPRHAMPCRSADQRADREPARTARPSRGTARARQEDRGRHRPDVGAVGVPARRAARPSGGRSRSPYGIPRRRPSRSSPPGRAGT